MNLNPASLTKSRPSPSPTLPARVRWARPARLTLHPSTPPTATLTCSAPTLPTSAPLPRWSATSTPNYNAGVVEVLNRSLKSLQFDANYTWSHALDFSQNALTRKAPPTRGTIRTAMRAPTTATPLQRSQPLRRLCSISSRASTQRTCSSGSTNDWSLDDSFQMQNGLPYTPAISGQASGAMASDWNGAGGTNRYSRSSACNTSSIRAR